VSPFAHLLLGGAHISEAVLEGRHSRWRWEAVSMLHYFTTSFIGV